MTLDLKALREKYALLTGWGYQAEVLALIDELTEARRERDDAKRREGDANEHLDMCVVARRERDAAEAALTHARAAAFEEAARHYDTHVIFAYGKSNAQIAREVANFLRALSATPATVVCVPVETWERAKAALESALGVGYDENGWQSRARAALAEMAKVKP